MSEGDARPGLRAHVGRDEEMHDLRIHRVRDKRRSVRDDPIEHHGQSQCGASQDESRDRGDLEAADGTDGAERVLRSRCVEAKGVADDGDLASPCRVVDAGAATAGLLGGERR